MIFFTHRLIGRIIIRKEEKMFNNLNVTQMIILGVMLGFLAVFTLILWGWAVLSIPAVTALSFATLLVGILWISEQ